MFLVSFGCREWDPSSPDQNRSPCTGGAVLTRDRQGVPEVFKQEDAGSRDLGQTAEVTAGPEAELGAAEHPGCSSVHFEEALPFAVLQALLRGE